MKAGFFKTMNTQAVGSFNFSGTYDNQTATIAINGVNYSQSITSTQSISDIVQQFNTYINTQATFTQYFTSTFDSSNLYITTIPGGRYDGDAGNGVTISSPNNNSGTTYVQASGSVNTFATQSPQYGNSTLVVGPFSTTIFCNAFSDGSAGIASTLNANATFSQNFVASSSQNFLVHITTKATGAYSGSLGNNVNLSISPYGSASGPKLTGGSTIQNVVITPSGKTLSGGVNYNNEIIDLFMNNFVVSSQKSADIIPNPQRNLSLELFSLLNDFSVTSQTPVSLILNPSYNVTMDVYNMGLTEWLSDYLLNLLISKGLCQPIHHNETTITDGITYYTFSGDDGIKNFENGFYYRIPVDSNSVNNQPTPKYLTQIPLPFTAFSYPLTDANSGKMLIKTFSPMTSLPNDVASITQIEAQTDLQNNVFTIFAL